ncbi:MAG: hypothetical protein OHK0053_08690 [Microscillaceae bacterium]
MDVVYSSPSLEMTFEVEKSLMVLDWKAQTAHWTEADFKAENLHIVEVIALHRPQYMLSLSQDFAYSINPENQVWIAENVFTAHKRNGVKKLALILSSDFIAQLSIEQSTEEAPVLPSAMFDNREEAEKWLFAD